jgi:hypothetical protein
VIAYIKLLEKIVACSTVVNSASDVCSTVVNDFPVSGKTIVTSAAVGYAGLTALSKLQDRSAKQREAMLAQTRQQTLDEVTQAVLGIDEGPVKPEVEAVITTARNAPQRENEKLRADSTIRERELRADSTIRERELRADSTIRERKLSADSTIRERLAVAEVRKQMRHMKDAELVLLKGQLAVEKATVGSIANRMREQYADVVLQRDAEIDRLKNQLLEKEALLMVGGAIGVASVDATILRLKEDHARALEDQRKQLDEEHRKKMVAFKQRLKQRLKARTEGN